MNEKNTTMATIRTAPTSKNKKRAKITKGAPSLVVIVASVVVQLLSIHNYVSFASSFVTQRMQRQNANAEMTMAAASTSEGAADTTTTTTTSGEELAATESSLFDEFASFLQTKQSEIIDQIEQLEREEGDATATANEAQKFSKDCWGIFEKENEDRKPNNSNSNGNGSGGITRVIQKGSIIEKGACSFTLLKNGKLTAERAASVRGRQDPNNDDGIHIQEGDTYCAAALSMVLHTRSPMVPTFRSDVRIFMVESSSSTDPNDETKKTVAWLGGGSDLTPYYLYDDDIVFFHQQLKDLCEKHAGSDDAIDYPTMKQACDEYFYLPARSEHRGVGGMFYDDLPATRATLDFSKDVASNWMSSWFPVVRERQSLPYTEQQREWQLLRRGRYLEFNLLYDRGVKFGLANANPRVEGVMVSAPPLIAWEYNHKIEPDSEEDRLMKILKSPIEWV